jgi:hypothetical protein
VPPSRVPRLRPHLLLEAHVTLIVGARRVVFTRQRAFCSLARVTATLRLFWPCTVGMGSTVSDLRRGATGDGACPPCAAVSGEVNPVSTAGSLFWVFFYFVCCVFLLFLQYSLSMYCSNFIGIFVGLMLDRPSFILE